MRYIIDDMPQDAWDCDFSEKISITEETEIYICKLDKQVCKLEIDDVFHFSGCRHLKEL